MNFQYLQAPGVMPQGGVPMMSAGSPGVSPLVGQPIGTARGFPPGAQLRGMPVTTLQGGARMMMNPIVSLPGMPGGAGGRPPAQMGILGTACLIQYSLQCIQLKFAV